MEPPSLGPALSIDIAVNSPLWDAEPNARDEQWVSMQFAPILALPNIRSGELSIALVDDAQIAALNQSYRGKPGPTNVLSFPADGPLLGDIVLAHETLTREAAEKGASFDAHLAHLLLHGFLHLQGYDHQTDDDAAKMEALEITALAQLGIDNPYEKQTTD